MPVMEYKKGEQKQLSKDFKLQNFHCHCKYIECTKTLVDTQLIEYLQAKRDIVGEPIIVNDGFRCPAHNAVVGGKEHSQHMLGKAADITIAAVKDKRGTALIGGIFNFLAIFSDADGLGTYRKQNFIHIDVRNGLDPTKHRARWNG